MSDPESLLGQDEETQRPVMNSFEDFGGDEVDYNPLFATKQRFSTRGKTFEWAQNIALENGFALVIANSGHKNRSQPELVASYFHCSRYGSSKVVYDPEKPKKKPKTVKCQCTFRIRAVENYHFEDKKQLVLWNIVTANGFGCHNHHPTKYKDGHHHYAGLNEEDKADIKSGLHQKTPDKPQPSSSQIYTDTSKIRKEMRRERNTAQQMLALAVEANYVHWHEINPDTHELTHVFMSHPEAVKLFRAYPHVVLIDSTYKTNTYNMALVEVVGVTPEGSSFLIACVLIPSESEEGYTWLLRKLMDILECTGASPSVFVTDRELGLVRALLTLFSKTPHLLCVGTQKWKRLASYISRTWGEHAKKFVLCCTNEYFHLGNTTTSRVESEHSLLKAWLKSAHLTLDTMWSRIHSMLEGQHSKIRKELQDSMSRPRITQRLFSLLQGKVSTKALEIMEDELKRGVALGVGLKLGCGCVLRTTHGLPCACMLVDMKDNGSRVHLSDIHSFWRTLEYDNEEAMSKNDNDMLEELVFLEKLRDILYPEDEDILAPAVQENQKGRPRGSTTRNKSSFEQSMRKYGTPSMNSSTNIQHMVGDFAAGVAGAPLEKNYTKWLLSTWVKRYGVPEELWPHFDGWVDVGSDGHCGFRVLSHALRGGEEDYIQMRDWCLKEISGSDVYKGLFEAGVVTKNGLSKYENTLRRIRFIHRTACGEDRWMSSEDLFVFASVFNWTICVIGENRYAKGPKKCSNEGVPPYGVLWIVNHKSHWMRLHSRGPPGEVPMPPIDPSWIVFREPSVEHLAALYKTNIENWHTFMGTTPRPPRRMCDPNVAVARALVFDDAIDLFH
ncbi:hypothetical protein RND81_05G089600 [Saponaria officinalis]|uniref:MULE transposase domain-containing protein n=1 Tax=Saponaria officinalis TaxID=3572 RepID=A0AAW1KYW3_SAPOF